MTNQKQILVIIPARGGSKGLPGKNIKLLNNMPLIAHSIKYAQECAIVNKILVSTDCKKIAKIAVEYNAEVIDRPDSISGDEATTESAIEHTLTQSPNKPDIIIILQPTSPLRPKNSLENALNTFQNGRYDSLLSISPTHRFLWKISDELATPMYDYKDRPRRQDISEINMTFIENGSVYIFTYEHFIKTKNRLGGKIGYIIFPEEYSLEIDSETDFKIMEKLCENI